VDVDLFAVLAQSAARLMAASPEGPAVETVSEFPADLLPLRARFARRTSAGEAGLPILLSKVIWI